MTGDFIRRGSDTKVSLPTQAQRRGRCSEKAAGHKPREAPPETRPGDTLILNFQPLELWENRCLSLQPPSLLLWQPEQRNPVGKSEKVHHSRKKAEMREKGGPGGRRSSVLFSTLCTWDLGRAFQRKHSPWGGGGGGGSGLISEALPPPGGNTLNAAAHAFSKHLLSGCPVQGRVTRKGNIIKPWLIPTMCQALSHCFT